jgi:hypothetical protein
MAENSSHGGESESQSLIDDLVRAPAYPFRGTGIPILIGGAAMLAAVDLLQSAPIPFLGLFFGVVAGTYICAYLFEMILDSADGQDAPPDWPAVTSPYDDLIRPFLMIVGTALGSFVPVIIYFVVTGVDDGVTPLAWALLAAGVAYFPMALLSVAIRDSLIGLNPVWVLPGILRTLPLYLLVLVLMSGTWLGAHALTVAIPDVPVVKWLVLNLLLLYVLMVLARLLGLLYWHGRNRLGWIPD